MARPQWSGRGKLVVLGAAVAMASALGPACGGTDSSAKSGPTSGSAGSAGDGARDGSTASGGETSVAGSGPSGTSGAGTMEGGDVWSPSGDAEWTPVSWAQCDGALFARSPQRAAPPLTWTLCGGSSQGCQRIVVTWSADRPPLQSLDTSEGSVFKDGGTTRFGLYLSFLGAAPVLAFYDESWVPIAAWRGPRECQPLYVEASAAHVCLAFGGRPASIALLPLVDPNAPPLQTFSSGPDIPLRCNARLLSALDVANRIFIRDLATRSEHLIGWPDASAWTPRIRDDYAVIPRLGGGRTVDGAAALTLEAWIWTGPNSLSKLIDAAPELIVDARSDGTTLAWVQSATPDYIEPAPGTLWKSPFSRDPAAITRTRVRDVPLVTVTETSFAIGKGYYGLIEGAPNQFDTRLHVYRLEDGRHWAVPRMPDVFASSPGVPAGSLTVPGRLLHIDDEEVWWVGYSQTTKQPVTLVRQRLDALGAGD